MNGTKGFFQSKIIWLAIVSLVLQLVSPLVGHEYNPAVSEEITSTIFSGTGIAQIAITILMILVRWLFTNKGISGGIQPGAGLFTAVLLITAVTCLQASPLPYSAKAGKAGISTITDHGACHYSDYTIQGRYKLHDIFKINPATSFSGRQVYQYTKATQRAYRRPRDGVSCRN